MQRLPLFILLSITVTTFSFAPKNLAHHSLTCKGLGTKQQRCSPTLALFPESSDPSIPLQGGFLQETNRIILAAIEDDISFGDSFTDEIDVFGDPTVRALTIGFGVLVILATAAKFFLNQMDSAIEKVLLDFESTMKRNYASRWVSIEAKLDGLEEPMRSQKLFEIMEGLEQDEPAFMEMVKGDMSS